MASIFTPYKLANGKIVQVPNKEVNALQAQLKISRAEAVDLWLFDNEYIENAEEQALTQKAKDNRITATIHKAKAEVKQKTQRERVIKEQPIKEEIIATIAKSLESIGATNIVIANKAKTITLTGKDGEPYAIDLKWERNKSKALKEGKG